LGKFLLSFLAYVFDKTGHTIMGKLIVLKHQKLVLLFIFAALLIFIIKVNINFYEL